MSSIDNRTKLGVMAFAGVGIALVMALLILPSFAGQDTYIFTGGNSGGSNSTSECVNLASQYNIILNTTNNTCYVRDLANGNGITMSTNGTHVIITNSKPESTLCTPDGAGNSLCGTTANVGLKTLSAGTSITIDCSVGQNCVITNSAPESTNCNNVGAGTVIHVTSSNCNAKSLKAGTGISISSNSTVITLTNSLPEQGCTSAGGTSIWKTASTCDAKGLTAGVGLTLTSNTNDNNYKTNFANGTGVTITGTTTQTFTSNCNNTGTGEAVCESANNINSLIATSPITVTDTTGDLTIACPTCATDTSNWVQLDNSSPSDGATTWTSGTFTAKKYLTLQIYIKNDATTVTAGNIGMRFNGDSGSNYGGFRYVGGSRTATTAQTSVIFCSLDENFGYYMTGDIFSPSGSVAKAVHADVTPLNGGNTAGDQECSVYGNWQNTSNQITTITLVRLAGTWAFDSTSTMVVYGHD